MTTLESIGFTLAGGSAVLVVTLGLFGVAVSRQSRFIAPRATARPRTVIFQKPDRKNPRSVLNRGNAWFGWIGWTLSLSYDTMLRGVPGTGTRNKGLSGALLNVNLDGIVLLRFHALCLKVAFFTTVLCMGAVLPLYYTASCTENPDRESNCFEAQANLTNYEVLTLANIPSLADANDGVTDLAKVQIDVMGRLYAIVLVFYIIIGYMAYLLNREWVHMLALRRVYYLEHDIWGARREELKQTMLFDEYANAEAQKSSRDAPETSSEPHLIDREPWIPHPEQKDTVSNIALYSVLVGNLPSLPNEASDQFDADATLQFSKRESIDWQLSVTTSFFDHCVPNQPGFSSSVAAVTIIPAAKQLATAWSKWYKAAKKLRRLRFIRQEIQKRRHYEIEIDFDDDEEEEEEDDQFDVELGNDPAVTSPREIYKDPELNRKYYREVLGSMVDHDGDPAVYQSLVFGPEQTAVYSREFAQSAGMCCPRGCREERIRRLRIDELMALEKRVAKEVHEANLELINARKEATMAVEPPASEMKVATSDEPDLLDISMKSDIGPSRPKKGKKGHRYVASLDGVDLPSDLGLEANLYNQMSTVQSQSFDNEVGRSGSSIKEDIKDLSMQLHQKDPNSPLLSPDGSSAQWRHVEAIVRDVQSMRTSASSIPLPTGSWRLPSVGRLVERIKHKSNDMTDFAKAQATAAVGDLARESTYAVITFTSRQAAVAARNCLADGRGARRWQTRPEIPVPPLADAAAWDLFACRNCCRPLTLSINERQKNIRNYCAILMLGLIYCFYTIPLTAATSLVQPGQLESIFSKDQLEEFFGSDALQLVSGFLSAMIYTAFFALNPMMFKAIANFGSKAPSVAGAEYKALQYYWWFMLLTAFSGPLLARMVINGLQDGLDLGDEFKSVLRDIAKTVPSEIAVTWLSWIIFRFTITLPLNYLLQINTFLFHFFGMRCCSRLVMGGGPGGPVPYRIYVDSGVVLMCTIALAPASPIVAPACFAYFLLCQPLLRRNLIFLYRPKFDGGGLRWPFVFDMIISGMLLASILLSVQMGLKQAIGPGAAAAVSAVPIFLFSAQMKNRYLRPFQDAALLQTSLLDGWDTSIETSMKKREEFRKFLVDAHKAAYVPICIAGADTDDVITAEPAVALPLESEVEAEPTIPTVVEPLNRTTSPTHQPAERRRAQAGATLRRAVQTITALRRRNSSYGSDLLESYQEEAPAISPFHRGSILLDSLKAGQLPSFNEDSDTGTASARREQFQKQRTE